MQSLGSVFDSRCRQARKNWKLSALRMNEFALKRIFSLMILLAAGCMNLDRPESRSNAMAKPPVAQRIPKVDIVHGERRVDDYFWLREKTNAAVAAYLEAENSYTGSVLRPTEKFQEALYQEMLGHIKETDLSVPYRKGDYFYYSRTEQGKQYPIHCRKKGN